MRQKLPLVRWALATIIVRHVACNLCGPDAFFAALAHAQTPNFADFSSFTHPVLAVIKAPA